MGTKVLFNRATEIRSLSVTAPHQPLTWEMCSVPQAQACGCMFSQIVVFLNIIELLQGNETFLCAEPWCNHVPSGLEGEGKRIQTQEAGGQWAPAQVERAGGAGTSGELQGGRPNPDSSLSLRAQQCRKVSPHPPKIQERRHKSQIRKSQRKWFGNTFLWGIYTLQKQGRSPWRQMYEGTHVYKRWGWGRMGMGAG